MLSATIHTLVILRIFCQTV